MFDSVDVLLIEACAFLLDVASTPIPSCPFGEHGKSTWYLPVAATCVSKETSLATDTGRHTTYPTSRLSFAKITYLTLDTGPYLVSPSGCFNLFATLYVRVFVLLNWDVRRIT